MNSRISIRGFRAGFFVLVGLLILVAAFTLTNALRTHNQVNDLVEVALERSSLMSTIRVDAVLLEDAVNAHIRAATDGDREEANHAMAFLLAEIDQASQKYTEGLPDRDRTLWAQLAGTTRKLVEPVRDAVKYSSRKEAERARKKLEEGIRPITWQLEQVATELSQRNSDETTKLLRELEDLRLRTTLVGSVVAVGAVLIALLVAWQVSQLIRRQEKTIEEQVAELDRRNKELDAFASRVAHDLVSPLSPLKGYLTLIRRSPEVQAPEVKELLTQAESSAAKMAGMVDALLRFCRAGRGSEAAVAELDTAVSSCLSELSQAAAAQSVALSRQLEDHVNVPVPQQLLQSIAQNVLSNAVKYSAGRPQARVGVRVYREKAQAVLEVTDNGVGMSEASLAQLFQPFFRSPETRDLPGHGLGLATTRRLVEAHGGSIAVHSALGVGTQVSVRLPLVDATVATSDPVLKVVAG